jgi:glycine betaine catabolism A
MPGEREPEPTLRSSLTPALGRAAYVDGSVWEQERNRIFASDWCAVARTEDLASPGSFLRVELAGESILLTRDADGTLHGFFNVCRHRGAELVALDGEPAGCVTGALQCPYHAWSYTLDGRLRHAPFLPPPTEAEREELALTRVDVDTWGGFVFVRLDGSGPTLAEQLGPIPGRLARYPLAHLQRGVGTRYDVAANWKVVAENYNECYHCGPIHPELCEVVPAFRRGGGDALDWERGIPHREGANTFTLSGTTTRAPFPGLDADELSRHKGELAYPNLLLSLARDHVAAFTLLPTGPSHTQIVFDLLFHPDAVADPAFDPADAWDLWDVTNRQDWAICESVQRGMGSRGFVAAWFAPMEDPSVDIRTWYEPRMSDG